MSPPIALRLAALALLVVLARAQTSSARVDVATRAAGRPANAANPATVVASRPSNIAETPSNASSRFFSPFYWGPQGYVIGPSWFGAGLGGGNWRPIPNHTPFGPPGYNQTEAPVVSPGDPCVFENFDCSVYTCRLGVTNTSQSTLEIFEDESGNYVARQRCFLLLDDFDAYGCRQWDRLKLDKTKTSEGPKNEGPYDCVMPPGVAPTETWTNDIHRRRSKLECEKVLTPAELARLDPSGACADPCRSGTC